MAEMGVPGTLDAFGLNWIFFFFAFMAGLALETPELGWGRCGHLACLMSWTSGLRANSAGKGPRGPLMFLVHSALL